jgi:hypothetical protein
VQVDLGAAVGGALGGADVVCGGAGVEVEGAALVLTGAVVAGRLGAVEVGATELAAVLDGGAGVDEGAPPLVDEQPASVMPAMSAAAVAAPAAPRRVTSRSAGLWSRAAW